MEFKRYQELKENMLNEYMKEWHDYDITLPSYEQAQAQEREGLILENQEGDDDEMNEIEKQFREVFGKVEPEVLKESSEIAVLFNAESGVLEIPQGVEGAELDVNQVLEAFGGTSKAEASALLQEAIGTDAEGTVFNESVTVDTIEEATASRPFTFGGRAFKVDVVNKNRRKYGRSISESALQQVKGRSLSVMAGHPKSTDTNPVKVVGKVVLGDIENDGWIHYKASLSNTRTGLDLQELLRDKCIGDVSLRSRGKTDLIDGVNEVVELNIKGLDLVREGAFQDAGVDEILAAVT